MFSRLLIKYIEPHDFAAKNIEKKVKIKILATYIARHIDDIPRPQLSSPDFLCVLGRTDYDAASFYWHEEHDINSLDNSITPRALGANALDSPLVFIAAE